MSGPRDFAAVRALDAGDPLAPLRARFLVPDGQVYLDGNSLGVLPAATSERVRRAVEQEWGQGLIGSWNGHGWLDAPVRLGAAIAPLIGAEAHEVVVADSTSVNLYKLIAAAFAASPDRGTILTEPGNFPTDLYVAGGAAAMAGRRVRTVSADRIADAIDQDVAAVLLTHVHYKTGRMLDMAAITRAAQAQGALMIWDLSHSAGAVELDLNGCNADLAVGCGYKYLNGGPGAPAFLFVAERHQARLASPLTGWMGHATPFAFDDDYQPAPDIRRFLCGTPPILGMAALESGLDCFAGVDMAAVVAKSRALSALFVELMDARCAEFGFRLISPRDPVERGSHVSYAHEHAYAICQALIARGVTGDFRAPDALRIGFTPLYTGFQDVWNAVDILEDVMRQRAWDQERYRTRLAVT